jgi:NurA-like 5'-3' nuclease
MQGNFYYDIIKLIGKNSKTKKLCSESDKNETRIYFDWLY